MAMLEAVLPVPTPCPSPPHCLRDQLPAPRAGGMSCWHSGVMSTPLSPRGVVPHCVSVFQLNDSHRCLSDKTMFKVFGEEEIEGREGDPLFAHLVQADLWLLGPGAKVTLG